MLVILCEGSPLRVVTARIACACAPRVGLQANGLTFPAGSIERTNQLGLYRYKFVNYPRLRTPSDYSKGSLVHKKREAARMLEWQNTVSNKSLTEMPKDLVKDAVTVRKSLLGYMGDKQMSFPETLAQNILMKGLDKPKVRDEVRPAPPISWYTELRCVCVCVCLVGVSRLEAGEASSGV